MAPDITVDVGNPTPPYEQIRSQIAAHVRSGRLAEGARLPTIRALAADLGVAAGTVARAYTELEAGGLVASRRRTGTVVTGRPDPVATREQRVHALAAELARTAQADDVDDETVLAAVRTALRDTAAARRPAGSGVAGSGRRAR